MINQANPSLAQLQEQLQLEAMLLQQITLAVSECPDFLSALEVVLVEVCRATAWDFGEVWLPDTQGTMLKSGPVWFSQLEHLQPFRVLSQGMTFAPGVGLPGWVWATQRPLWIQDVSQESDTIFLRAKAALAVGLRSGLAVPIVANGQVLAVLSFFMQEARPEDQRAVELVQAIATQLGSLIQRKQAEAALRQSERRLRKQNDVLVKLAKQRILREGDLNRSLQAITEAAVATLEAERAGVWLYNNDASRLVCIDLFEHQSQTHRQGPELVVAYYPVYFQALEENRTIAACDVHTDPRTQDFGSDYFYQAGIASTLDAPIRLGGQIVGTVCLEHIGSPRQWALDEQNFVASLADLVSLMIEAYERERTEVALREKEAFLRLVLDSIPQYIFWKDRHSVYLGCNQKFARVAGVESPEAIAGKTDYDLPWSPEETAMFRALDQQVMQSDAPVFQVMQSQRTASGVQTWTETSKVPLHDAEGNVIGILGNYQDVTERQRAEAASREAEAKYRSIFENVVEGIFQTTPDGRYRTANPMLAQIYGYDSPEELMATLTDIQQQLYVDPTRREVFRALIQDQDAVWGFESEIYRKDGSVIWISENARTIRDASGRVTGYEGTVEDITKRKQAEAELQKREMLLQGVAEATHHLLTETHCHTAISKALATLGQAAGVDRVYIYENHPHASTGELAISVRFAWNHILLEAAPPIYWENQTYASLGLSHWYDVLAAGQSISGCLQTFAAAEQQLLQTLQIRSILVVPILMDGQFWGFVGFDDCQVERSWSKGEELILLAMAASIGGALRREQAEATIRYQAFHDLLTGLPNRTAFNHRLSPALLASHTPDQQLAVLFLDLDRFKTINDTLGHAVGDQLLQQVADRLVHCLREGDIVSRWGGDEFTLLLPQIVQMEAVVGIAQRILDSLKPAFQIEGHELYITSSIGIALYPQDGDDLPTLLCNADAALYQAKGQGRNNYQFYTPALNSEASERLDMENRLHHALERGEFVVYYQPQVRLATQEITSMEALVRWQHPQLGLLPPGKFIPLAEENGLITQIGAWVLQTACAQNQRWREMGFESLRVSVNLSARQFQEPDLVQQVTQVLQQTRLPPAGLELEITETVVMQNLDFTTAMLNELHQMGIGIALDDFGAGYSSLSYLKKFPLHTLKIDRSFVQDLQQNHQDLAIASAVLTLGRGLNLSVVAEGVETAEQLEVLRSLHCEAAQGYLFSHPLSAQAATEVLQAWPWQP